jgi:hypothetical protein
MRQFSETEQAVLEYLAEFQYLTSTQFMRLGLTKTRKGIYPALRRMLEDFRPTIARINYTVSPTQGRPESVHYLTNYGVKTLVKMGLDEAKIKHPRRSSVTFASDHAHRISTINFLIDMKLWVNAKGYGLDDFTFYFQQAGGSNRFNRGGHSLSDNRIDIENEGVGYIMPDAIAIVERKELPPLFALFEQHNGKDTKRFLEQVHGHILAMERGAPSIKFDVKHNGEFVANRVFAVFENEGIMQASMQRLAKSSDFRDFLDRFYFKSEAMLEATGFGESWLLANGREVNFD